MMYEPFALSLSKGFDKLSPTGIEVHSAGSIANPWPRQKPL